jgi:DNA-binding HxlR family transcriptional regulator
MVAGDQLGERTLRVLHDAFMLGVLRELQSDPARAKDIRKRTPGVSLAGVGRRLRELVGDEFVVALDEAGRGRPAHARAPRNAIYELSHVGDALLDTVEEASRWERRWFAAKQHEVPGLLALGLAADGATHAIVRALADGHVRSNDLEARAPELKRTLLFRRVHDLTVQRLLLREEQGGNVSYRLSGALRELATVPLRAAHCESLRGTTEDRSLRADLWGLLHVVAPLAQIPTELAGTLLVHVESSRVEDVYLAAAAGRISALPVPPVGEPQATGRGSTADWCDVLFGGDPGRIATDADPALVSGIFLGLTRAMRPSGAANLDE